MTTIGTTIRKMRKAKKLSVRELAEHSGVSHPYLSQIETGKNNPSPTILIKLAKGLQCDYLFLMGVAGYENELKFRLDVHKLKCVDCDVIFLVETPRNVPSTFVCPVCAFYFGVEEMGVITMVEE